MTVTDVDAPDRGLERLTQHLADHLPLHCVRVGKDSVPRNGGGSQRIPLGTKNTIILLALLHVTFTMPRPGVKPLRQSISSSRTARGRWPWSRRWFNADRHEPITIQKYGERGRRYVHAEVGAAAQNVYRRATALNLETVFVGAFADRKVKEVLDLPETHQPLGIMPVGYAP